MSWIITPTYDGLVSDPDANTYLAAVQAADGQLLEPDVRIAVNNFIVGCKADGIWSAIKASCILAGARTLDGALVPLVGTAPTNNNFVEGDYNRKTGLVGNGSTKYLNSNRAPNADPQNSSHLAAYTPQVQTTGNLALIGSLVLGSHYSVILRSSTWAFANNTPSTQLNAPTNALPLISNGLFAVSRDNSASFNIKAPGYTAVASLPSAVTTAIPYTIFARNYNNSPDFISSSPITFYSIGESLDLAALDARVTTLMSDLAAAIP